MYNLSDLAKMTHDDKVRTAARHHLYVLADDARRAPNRAGSARRLSGTRILRVLHVLHVLRGHRAARAY